MIKNYQGSGDAKLMMNILEYLYQRQPEPMKTEDITKRFKAFGDQDHILNMLLLLHNSEYIIINSDGNTVNMKNKGVLEYLKLVAVLNLNNNGE